jgi:hypothetical protein
LFIEEPAITFFLDVLSMYLLLEFDVSNCACFVGLAVLLL